ncbi:scarecrow-like protein 33 [Triticum dicoccoides]|uniref:scarecrow-like protein 33 n=1 Tax=Triticum dicoccoides TaxID=85692 RepID=UPI00188E1FA0|nr:scarecrow-like protein 33 [Triticum dicoccoides]
MTVIYPLQIQYSFTASSEISMHSTMAATPEELLLGLAEPAPLSPSVFLDLPPSPTTHGDSQQPQNDLALEYISRMLTEEDIVDKFFYQYPDHPELLQAEQPFAEILADTSSDAHESFASSTSILMPSQGNGTDFIVSGCQVQYPAFFLNGTGTGTGTVEPSGLVFPIPSESSTRTDMLSSMAFFKGMEEANRFLPADNVMVADRGRKKRWSGMDAETEAGLGRSSKQITALPRSVSEEEEETTALEMLDRLVLNGYDAHPGEMQEVVRVTLEDKENKAAVGRRGRRGARHTVVTDLETLLIRCAEAVSSNDVRGASKLLERIKWHSSPTGDAKQRLAHYFAQGLEARLAGTGSRLYRALMGKHTLTVELIKAYHLHMAACCSIKVGLLFAINTICKAVAGRRKLHIVHYGITTGFQWPDLLRLLANREGGPPQVRITGINTPRPGLRPAQIMEEAGDRLSNCARQFGVPFEFRAIASKLEDVRAEDLHIDPDEVLVVNSLYEFRTLMDESLTFDMVSLRDMVLNNISKMRPGVFVQSLVNGPYSAAFFMTRFRHALYYFTALFDVMENTVPRDNDQRLLVERDIFARSAINMIACEGADRVERPQNYKEWQARNERAGLRQLPLDPDVVLILKDQVKSRYHKHFMISEDHRWLLQGWKGRVLYAHSTWASQVID